MALRFLADHCISNFTINTLREAQHEVLRLRDLAPPDSPDTVVIAKAQGINAILISLNGDFADIVKYPPGRYQGIIALQLRNHAEAVPHLMDRLVKYLNLQPEMEHYKGKLFLVEVDRIRIRQ